MKNISEMLHEIVWKRYIRFPFGHLLDYAEPDGSTIFPTKEQCEADFPNPMGWWTPSENGSFFTGLYLAALTEKYKLCLSEKTADEINLLIEGLFLNQDISEVDGFIARGVANDGISHYKLSSEDQVGPWVYGLWCAYFCDAVSEDVKSEIAVHIEHELEGLYKNGFDIPCEWKGHNWGSFIHADFRGCAKLLGCVMAAYTVTGKKKWLDLYEKLAEEKPDGIFTRAEICRNGLAPDMVKNNGLIQFWIHACAHLFVKMLVSCDKKREQLYREGLRNNGVTAVKFLDGYKDYLSVKGKAFDTDWTKISHLYRKPENPTDGMNIALEQNRYWMKEIVPERHAEHNMLGNMLFASVICATSENESVKVYAEKKINEAIKAIDWQSLNLSYAFVAESVLYYLQNEEKIHKY